MMVAEFTEVPSRTMPPIILTRAGRPAAAAAAARSWAGRLALLALLVAAPAGAQEPGSTAETSVSWMDRVRGGVRQTTATLAQELDAFLSDREYVAGLNETRVALTFGIDRRDSGDTRVFLSPELRLSLPNTERRLFIDVFGVDPTRWETSPPTPGAPLLSDGGDRIEAVQLRLGTTVGGLEVAPAFGVRADDGDLRAYAGVRIGGARDLGEGVRLSGSQRLYLDSERWLQAITLLRADRESRNGSLLRGQLIVNWRRDRDGIVYEPSVFYRRFLGDRTAMSLETRLELHSVDGESEDRLVSDLRLRRRLNEDWLSVEVRPWVSVPRDRGSDPTHGLELSMQVEF
jgi:hypothetical protein